MIDAVGFEAKGSTTETILSNLKIEGSSGKALRQCIAAVRRGGVVSVPGVYAGFIHGFLFGDAFDKGLSFKMGQTHVHAWLGELLPLIEKGLLTPEDIVTHYLPLADAERAYKIFEKREEECRKVIAGAWCRHPGGSAAESEGTGECLPRRRCVRFLTHQWRSRYSTATTRIARMMRKTSVITSISPMTVPTAPQQSKRGLSGFCPI